MTTRRDVIAALLLGPLGLVGRPLQALAADELTSLSIVEARRRLTTNQISAPELAEAFLARIRSANDDVKAFVTVTAARARADAGRVRLSAPLGGIPIAHKDLFETHGIRTTAGSLLYASHIPTTDAVLVAALARSGTVLLGKTNTHELGGGVTTINPFYGTTRNPTDRLKIAGGSSGGSAAAVAARLTMAASGSDTGGSVRIPAALCGCVGFKPTFGRLSTTGLLGACPTFDHAGLLTRSVGDMALLFETLTVARRQPRDHPRLRVGVARRFFFDGVQPDIEQAIDRTIDSLRSRAAAVVDRDLPLDDETMARVFNPIVASEIWARYGEDWRRRPEAFSRAFATAFADPPPSTRDVAAARRARQEFQQDVDQAFDDVDVILTPTVPVTAPAIADQIDGGLILRNTWPFNAARTPTVTVPCGVDRTGMPIGLQIAGRLGTDTTVLLAAQLVADHSS